MKTVGNKITEKKIYWRLLLSLVRLFKIYPWKIFLKFKYAEL